MEDEPDPVDEMIKKTGCMDAHIKVQLCAAEHQDWRKCQDEVKEFRSCMTNYYNNRKPKKTEKQI